VASLSLLVAYLQLKATLKQQERQVQPPNAGPISAPETTVAPRVNDKVVEDDTHPGMNSGVSVQVGVEKIEGSGPAGDDIEEIQEVKG